MWKLVHEDDVGEGRGSYPAPADTIPLSHYQDLGRAAGSLHFGVSKDRIPPGARTSLTHAHSAEEEFVYVLEGACTLRIVEPGAAPRSIPIRAGHAIAFPAGTGVAHSLINEGHEDCVVLVVGERRNDDRVFYPEHAEYDASLAARKPERHWAPADRPGATSRDRSR